MKLVAEHLEKEALTRSDEDGRDIFGRSAFNRYYYATFLQVRDALQGLRPEWSEMPHADIPKTLRGQVINDIKKGRTKAIKNDDYETSQMCQDAIKSSKTLAEMMDAGRTTRVTADYKPEIPISFAKAGAFELNTVSIKDARSWPAKAASLIKTIERAWRQIHA